MKRISTVIVIAIASIAGFYAVDYLLNALRFQRVPKNFAVVKPNVLYRAGQMRPEHFETVVRTHGIKTVVCLNPGNDPTEAERARRLGLEFVTFNMPGSGQGEAAFFHEFLRIVGDQPRRPVLVHCAAGAYRTGVAVALYRMLYDGWALEDALREMRNHGCPVDGDRPLIEHLQACYASIPADLCAQLSAAPPTQRISTDPRLVRPE